MDAGPKGISLLKISYTIFEKSFKSFAMPLLYAPRYGPM